MGTLGHFITRLPMAIAWSVLVACLGLLGVFGVGPRSGRYATFTVLSGSMQPGIPIGAVVLGTPEPAGALRIGQVITYAIPIDDHRVITHRVVEITGVGEHRAFRTKGDANNAVDPWRTEVTTAIVWRERAVVPGLGFGIHWLRDRTVHVVGVLILPAAVTLWWLVGIWRRDDDDVAGVAAP